MTTHAQCADFPTPLEDFLACLEFIAGGPVFEAKSVSLFSKRLCPATSGRFCRKRAPISPWVLGFWTVFGGGCRRWLRRPGETSAPRGVSGRFGLRNRSEVANGACGRQGWGSKRCEAGRIRGAQGVRRVPKGVPCAGGLASVNRGRRCVHFRTHLRPLFMCDYNRASPRRARLVRGGFRAGEGDPLPVGFCR